MGGVVEARHGNYTTKLSVCGVLVNGPTPSHRHRDLDWDAVSNAELAYGAFGARRGGVDDGQMTGFLDTKGA